MDFVTLAPVQYMDPSIDTPELDGLSTAHSSEYENGLVTGFAGEDLASRDSSDFGTDSTPSEDAEILDSEYALYYYQMEDPYAHLITKVNDDLSASEKSCNELAMELERELLAASASEVDFKQKERVYVEKAVPVTFICFICGRSYKNEEDMREHVRADHISKQRGKFPCGFCKKLLVSEMKLRYHVKRQHLVRFECKQCPRQFADQVSLTIHFAKDHSDFLPAVRCKRCEKDFVTEAELKRHDYYCERKDEILETRKLKREQVLKETESQFDDSDASSSARPILDKSCPTCRLVCASIQSLKRHIQRKHPEVDDFQPSYVPIHSPKHPFACDICRKGFASNSALNIHRRRTHDNVKPWQCEHCNKTYPLLSELKKHNQRERRKDMAAIETGLPPKGSVAAMVNRMSRVDLPMKMPSNTTPKPLPKSPSLNLRIVLFNYEAAEKDELELHVGDVLEWLRDTEEGWALGRRQRDDKEGLYPTNFVKDHKPHASPPAISATRIEPTPSSGHNDSFTRSTTSATAAKRISQSDATVANENAINGNPPAVQKPDSQEMARVLFTYQASHPDEISLNKVGQMVKIIDKNGTDPGWMVGELDGKQGLFPENFVEIVKMGQSPSMKPPAKPPGGMAPIVPPVVPAKPPKSILSTSSTNVSEASSAATSTAPARPVSAAPASVRAASSGGVGALRNQLLNQGLFAKGAPAPGDVPVLTKPATNHQIEQGPSLDEPIDSDATTSQLVHLNKARPKQPAGRRPMSVYAGKRLSEENLLDNPMTRSTIVSSNNSHESLPEPRELTSHDTSMTKSLENEKSSRQDEPRFEPKTAILPNTPKAAIPMSAGSGGGAAALAGSHIKNVIHSAVSTNSGDADETKKDQWVRF
ncbi:unnamed protein product, partial [Mesorhabditis spiculigera]